MASPMERNQRVDEILRSLKVSFSSTLQPPEDGLLRGGCHYKTILWNWPKKTLILYYVLLQLTCSCHCCWPSSFLPSHVASKRAQGFSSEVDILESIRHVFFQRQVCIWNKCARDHFPRKFLFALYSSALTEVYVFNCYFILWKKWCISFLSRFRTISNYNRAGDLLCTGYGFRVCSRMFCYPSLSNKSGHPMLWYDCVWHFRH